MDVSVFCFLASYLCAFGLECRRLYRRTGWNRALVLLFTAAGLVAHTVYLWNRHAQADPPLPPLLSSTHDWMLVLAWMAVLVYLFLLIADHQLAIGVFLLPLVLGLVGLAYFVSREPNSLVRGTPEMREVAGRVWAMLHATLLVFGIAAVIFGFVLSLMYLVQHRRLKHKHAQRDGLTLPNLERLAWLNKWAVVLSVPLLTLGLLTGVLLGWLARDGANSLPLSDPVVVVSGIAWLVLVAFFVWFAGTPARRTSGRQVAWLTVVAFGFLLVTLVGLQVLTGKLGGSLHASAGGWGRPIHLDAPSPAARPHGSPALLTQRSMPQRGAHASSAGASAFARSPVWTHSGVSLLVAPRGRATCPSQSRLAVIRREACLS